MEDDRKTIFVYEKHLALAGFQALPPRSVDHARNPATADIPVLLVTVTNKASEARALGADELWLKPLDPSRLVRKLRSFTHPRVRPRVLVIDDDARSRYVERKMLDVLDVLDADPRTRSIPVVVVTSHALDATEITRLEVQTGAILSKQHLSRELAILRIRDALRVGGLADPQAGLPGATRSGVP